MLNVIEAIPEGMLDLEAHELHRALSGPTLIHLKGRLSEPLLVTALLHGNEATGWIAVRELLKQYADKQIPRSLSIFIGNVAAARARLRRLDDQPDYNRIWNGTGLPEHEMARRVVEEMHARNVFASIDIHNNTGLNPHYSCVNRLDSRYLELAVMFNRTVVYFIQPNSVHSMAMANVCPAVTLECGQPGSQHSVDHAQEYIGACLKLSRITPRPVSAHDIDLFHTRAIVKVPPEFSFKFDDNGAVSDNDNAGDDDADIIFVRDADHYNFRELPAGALLGRVRPGSAGRLNVTDETGEDVSERYFTFTDGEIRTNAPVMPSMLTLDLLNIRQDCFCYLMERYNDNLSAARSWT